MRFLSTGPDDPSGLDWVALIVLMVLMATAVWLAVN